MIFARSVSLTILVAALLGTLLSVPAFAQVGFSLTWNGSPVAELVQNDCYDMDLGPAAAWTTLNIEWSLNGSPQQPIYGWPSLDGSGRAANICTSGDTPLGDITFTKVSGPGFTLYPNANVHMIPQAGPAWFNVAAGYAGRDSYRFYVANVYNRDVRVQYIHDGGALEEGVIHIDPGGFYDSPLFDHYYFLGYYLVTGVRLESAQPGNWAPASASFTILPPQPYSLYTDASQVNPGATNGTGSFRMLASNGGGMDIDFRYRIDNNPEEEQWGWPWLYGSGPWGWDGESAGIFAQKCTRPGTYRYTAVRNSMNAQWEPIYYPAQIVLTHPGNPSVTSVSPLGVIRGQGVRVTVRGQNLCGVELRASNPNITFSQLNDPDWSDGTSFDVWLGVPATVPVGNVVVTVHTRGTPTTADKTFTFGVAQAGALPSISDVVPSSGAPGTTITLRMDGTNLFGPSLSTTWGGLQFSNIVANAAGTSFTVTLTIDSNALLGTAPIQVTTAAGNVTTNRFTVGNATLTLSREYIYLGDRVLAVESP